MQTRRRHADKVKFGWNYLSRRRSLFQNVRRRKSCFRHSSWTPAAKRHQTTPSLLLFILFYFIFLTPVLNSQGMKKITPCSTKKYKNQAGIKLTPPPPSQNSHAVKWHPRLQYNIKKRNNKQKNTTE